MPRRKVLVALAGDSLPPVDLFSWGKTADVLIAADAGADRLHEAGLSPQIIVGDMDSKIGDFRGARCIIDRDLDHSDCEKATALCEQEHLEDEVLFTGVEGDRLDHGWCSILALAGSQLRPWLALRMGLASFVRASSPFHGSLEVGSVVSLIPLSPCHGVTLTGVEWPLRDEQLHPTKRFSLSNRVAGPIRGSVESGTALLVVGCTAGLWGSDLSL